MAVGRRSATWAGSLPVIAQQSWRHSIGGDYVRFISERSNSENREGGQATRYQNNWSSCLRCPAYSRFVEEENYASRRNELQHDAEKAIGDRRQIGEQC